MRTCPLLRALSSIADEGICLTVLDSHGPAATFGDGGTAIAGEPVGRKGLVYVAGKLQTRRWRKDGEDSDRFATEILLVPGGRIQFLDKPNGANGSGAQMQAGPDAAVDAGAMPDGGAPADPDSEIPF